ncbi:MAG: glycosyltransferase family 2 protein, partial [Fischerella sp.]|nr:glycosyltransferase family 2 protein [Fischerella sp.]
IQVVNSQGQLKKKRLPPPLRPRGAHFSLENLEPGYSYHTKQTLVVERQVIQQIGGWDETFRSRVHSELFLRLNPVCSIIGLPIITYQLYSHEGERISRDPKLRQESFQRLVNKHKSLFKTHPKAFANFVYEHARMSYKLGQKGAALTSLFWAMRLDPILVLKRIA